MLRRMAEEESPVKSPGKLRDPRLYSRSLCVACTVLGVVCVFSSRSYCLEFDGKTFCDLALPLAGWKGIYRFQAIVIPSAVLSGAIYLILISLRFLKEYTSRSTELLLLLLCVIICAVNFSIELWFASPREWSGLQFLLETEWTSLRPHQIPYPGPLDTVRRSRIVSFEAGGVFFIISGVLATCDMLFTAVQPANGGEASELPYWLSEKIRNFMEVSNS